VGGMRWRRVLGYVLAQLVGAVAAGGLVLLLFGAEIARLEAREGLVRGTPGAERAAAMFGEAFPPPSAPAGVEVTAAQALLAEAGGTAFLLLVVVGLARVGTWGGRPRLLARAAASLAVAAAILALAPLTQCGINPARDLGPRLVAWAAGFGPAAFPGSQGGWWVYVLGPLAGGLVGAAVAAQLTGRVGRAKERRG
jgi:glycerol uptake facilitator protein